MKRNLILISILCTSFSIIQGQSSVYYKAVRLNNAQPIITEQMFTDIGGSYEEAENLNGPSVIRVPDWIAPENRANPEAQYYCYFAHHAGEYIRMAWAATIDGPWHLYDVGTGVSVGDRGVLDHGGASINVGGGYMIDPNHLASPNVQVDDVNQRIIIYFHSGSSSWYNSTEIDKQITWVATSPYGLEFNGNIEPVFLGNSYFSVFEYGGEIYALDNGATIYKALDPLAPWAIPLDHNYLKGLWSVRGDNPFQDAITDNTGLTSDILRVRHANTRVVGDELHAFYSRRGDLLECVQMSTVDMSASDWKNWTVSWPPVTILESIHGWEGGELTPVPSETSSAPENVNQLRDPYVFEDNDGLVYLFYTGRGEDAIGVAALLTSDTEFVMPPAKPYLLKAKVLSDSEISLSWTDNADNETGYIVERKLGEGEYQSIATLASNGSSYSDTDLLASSSYTYKVAAFSAEGYSNYSDLASATTYPSGAQHFTHLVSEDTYIRGDTYANDNFGSDADLVVKKGNLEDFFRYTLVKFDLSNTDYLSGAVDQAVLKLYANKAKTSNITASEYSDNWTENLTTWNTAPNAGSAIESTDISSAGLFYEWDITDYVKSQLESDKIVSISLGDLGAMGETIQFNSKESGSNTPKLDLLINSNYVIESTSGLESSSVRVYPNPTQGLFIIENPSGNDFSYEIYSMQGRIIARGINTEGSKAEVDLSGIEKGIYIVITKSSAGQSKHKLVVQ